MDRLSWLPGDLDRLQALRAEGTDYVTIAQMLGRSADACRCKFNQLRREGKVAEHVAKQAAPPPASEMQAFSSASTDARVKDLEKQLDGLRKQLAEATGQKRVPMSTAAEPPILPAEAWARAEDESDRRILHAFERSRFHVNFDEFDRGPVAVCFVSDQHISPGNTVDHRRMREDAELIATTDGLYACIGGDGVDNHILIRPAMLGQRTQPSDQWQLYEWYLGIFAPKIMALISGNHDAWTDQLAGVDMVSEIARRQRLCYCPAEAHIKATVGGVEYAITFRHQYRFNSSMNQGHAVKQLWRFGEESFDIGCVCHHHEPHVESFEAHGETRWACRPGSYQITSSYSRQYGYNATRPTCPTFILFPERRRIIGFRDMRDAVLMLNAIRS